MVKIFHLSTCDTCQRIIRELDVPADTVFQDIKTQAISPEQLDAMKEKAGTYESLFSRQARKYREWSLKDKKLSENDYRELILQEYTFLKRPVIQVDETFFIGNAPKTVEAAKAKIHGQ
ncbi:MAG TPA: ArsC/Spx/MgsR family protein [Saprospiraceae bacterium]|nr:ArsC/Spx/MgsR family protein [Saprospiraceae bacterium]HMQ84904.1 ArsC/Spx/MgsR family protein [Saprospiraceae bacterium]